MGTVYYVTVDGDRVEGPFATRSEAQRRAAELSTNEVHLTYLIERVREGPDA